MGLVCKLTVTHDQFSGGRSHPRDREGRLARDLEQSQVPLETGEALAIPRNS